LLHLPSPGDAKRSREFLTREPSCIAAAHSQKVFARDLNPRAVAFASFNARLNGIENVDCSVLATLALTIPAVLIVGLLQRTSVTLGLNGVEGVMLALTLSVGVVTFSSGRTNVLQGAVHLVLFLAYLMLIFRG
jgi:hypothetical protein